MKENKLRYHIDHDLPLLSTRLWSTQPFFWEAIGATGTFDYVEFVAEYAPYDFTDLPNMARAAELNDMGTMIKLDFQNRGYVAQKAVRKKKDRDHNSVSVLSNPLSERTYFRVTLAPC